MSPNDHPDIEKLPLDIEGIPVRETIRKIFRNTENGMPDGISKAGCLELALKSYEVSGNDKGHVVWNAWRKAFPARWEFVKTKGEKILCEVTSWVNVVDFSGVNFKNGTDYRLWSIKNFSRFEFDNGANFSNTPWSVDTNFRHACFGHSTDFENSKWEGWLNFEDTKWGNETNFKRSQWGANIRFNNAVFGDRTDFSETTWKDVAFSETSFGRKTNFSKAIWHESAYFGTTAKELKHFYEIDFSGATFSKEVNFLNRKFLSTTLFKHIQFSTVPSFHGCELHQDTSFEGAVFPPATGSEETARAYRTLKLAFSKQQAIREEQRFFRLEMQEETVGHRLRTKQALQESKPSTGLREAFTWFWYKSYSVVSDYGFSVARPFLLLIAAWLVFAQIYGSYSINETACLLGQSGCDLQGNWLSFSLQQALPLPGFDKLEPTIKGVSIVWLFLHKTISLVALFFVGLGLRNLFKFK